jgi:hypothetical protein
MARTPKRHKPRRIHPPGSPQWEQLKLDELQEGLRAWVEGLEAEGVDPALKERIRQGWNPGLEMAISSVHPANSEILRTGCRTILMRYLFQDKDAQLKLGAKGDPADTTITIQVAAFAAGPETRRAVDAQKSAIEASPKDDDDVFTA